MQFEQLGPYRLGKKLGQGGMGAVYAGVDSETGEAAAIKVLSPSLAAEEGFRVRFEAEIESLKKLRHPNIVRLYGYGEQAGTLFYAMELVEGTSLEDELRAGRRFEWREVTQIAIKLCRALKHAHDHGVIHRDLKPANLLLTRDGEVKLSDFGIARLFGNTRLTSDGGVLGTAEYMAPEQADGRTVTDRCDQYSLGGVLYALLSGRPPFRAKTLVEMLQLQRFAEPEPVTRYAPQTPGELARIIQQLLSKEPQDRFVNTLMLSRSLEAMERGLSLSLSRAHDDFVVTEPDTGTGLGASGYSTQAPTLSPDELAAKQRAAGLPSGGTDVAPLDATEATMAYTPAAAGRGGGKSSSAPAVDEVDEVRDTSIDRFTKVAERGEDRETIGEALAAMLTPQTIALALALVALVGVGWYMMQPPSADALYGQIEAMTAEGDPDSVAAAAPKIESFLAQYPDDARVEKLRAIQDEAKAANPIERAYVEAKRTILINPELALEKFDALVAVYDDGEQGSEISRHYVKLARQQRKRVEKQIARYSDEARKLVEGRLAKAAELAATDPAAARRIYQGIVELYDDKPWASELVVTAKSRLATLTSPQTAAE